MTVFVELVFIENFIVDYFLLLLCAKMTLLPAKHPFFAAGFGAVYACVMPLWQPFQSAGLKIAVLLCMLAISFRPKRPREAAYLTASAFAMGCALYGAVEALLLLERSPFRDTGMMLYSDSAIVYLFLCSAFGAFLLYKSGAALFARRRLKQNTARLILGDRKEIKALVDTGNSLYYKGTPVVLVERDALGDMAGLPVQPLVIPFRSVGKDGALLGFSPEKVTVIYDEKTVDLKCVVAICDHGFQNGFGALLHPDLIRECV